ncbi:MAG: amino acid ABC transporter substrate-binding protein [Pelagibacteraceae bacterium BACL20 MAG-120920-bin64]|nr:MAG: amino acid ABC transporter substrate-binding protein [Pelagibacteraceae bacterium BACL20 MAG-120920-bin64]
MKSLKFITTLISSILILFATTSLSFAKVVGDTIVLGSAISLTGKYATNGEHTQRGYDLGVKIINEAGGVKVGGKTYKLDVKYYDDESNSAKAAALAQRLIEQDGVQYMLGPYGSGLTIAIAPVTEKFGVPMVEANGASRALFTKGYKYLFAVLNSADQYLNSAVDLMADKKKGATVALAFEQDSFSLDVKLGVMERIKANGMKVVIDDALPKELNDMTATLQKVKALKPDLLIVSGHAKGAMTAIKQMNDLKVDVNMLAMTHCDAAAINKNLGGGGDYTLCAAQWHKSLSYKDNYFGSGLDYAKLFESIYKYDPPYQAAESSAALLVYKEAFERANSFDKDKVRDALAKTDMQTFYGGIKFNDAGQNTSKPMVLFQVQDGKNNVVAPIKWAEAKLIYPIPKWKDR